MTNDMGIGVQPLGGRVLEKEHIRWNPVTQCQYGARFQTHLLFPKTRPSLAKHHTTKSKKITDQTLLENPLSEGSRIYNPPIHVP